MKRRSALQLVVIGSAAPLVAQQHEHAASAAAAAEAPAKLRVLTPVQDAQLDALCETIIPADSHSPGAHEAKVSAFIDGFLATSPAAEQLAWKTGLAAVEAEAVKRFGKSVVDCSGAQRIALLKEMAEGEASPATDLQRFFVKLKRQTLSGYYTSSVGLLKDLEYKGIVPIAEYPACEHPDHQPANTGTPRK